MGHELSALTGRKATAMKLLIVVSMILHCLSLTAIGFMWASDESRYKSAFVKMIVDDPDGLMHAIEAATIANHKKRFHQIYLDLGLEFEKEPTTIAEMLQPLVDLAESFDQESLELESDQLPDQEDESDHRQDHRGDIPD